MNILKFLSLRRTRIRKASFSLRTCNAEVFLFVFHVEEPLTAFCCQSLKICAASSRMEKIRNCDWLNVVTWQGLPQSPYVIPKCVVVFQSLKIKSPQQESCHNLR